MSKVKVLSANFTYAEISTVAGGLFIKENHFQLSTGLIPITDLITLEVADEDNVKKIGGSMGWGVVGGVLAGPVGILAGALLGGNKKETTFVAELSDGRQFIGTVDSKSFMQVHAQYLMFAELRNQ